VSPENASVRDIAFRGDEMTRYTYRVEWLPDCGQYIGRCLEMPWLYAPAATAQEAVAGVHQMVDERVADMIACGADPPKPFGDRAYSGKFLVRTSVALHRRLSIEAAEEGVSLNQCVVQQLSGRKPPTNLWDI
jgi:predicted HicB family RNase H-like nuclease